MLLLIFTERVFFIILKLQKSLLKIKIEINNKSEIK